MKWSLKIARVAGIDIQIHATFLLILGWVAFSYYLVGRSLNAAAVRGRFFTGVVFMRGAA